MADVNLVAGVGNRFIAPVFSFYYLIQRRHMLTVFKIDSVLICLNEILWDLLTLSRWRWNFESVDSIEGFFL